MKYIYGPVKSRRLGLSLGVSVIPHKTCNFDCIYCQLGKGEDLFIDRQEYSDSKEILEEVRLWLNNHPEVSPKLDYITLSGWGEPTLNIKIGELISSIKRFSPAKVAVITNASLMGDPQLRKELLDADLLVPSLDSVVSEIFHKINRPYNSFKVEETIQGLIALRREYSGKIWLEIMVVRGVNDDLNGIKKLKEIVDKINPDKIQINSPVRKTAENNVAPADQKRLKDIKKILGKKCEVI